MALAGRWQTPLGLLVASAASTTPGFLEFVRDPFERHAFPRRRLCFEIAEPAAIVQPGKALQRMERLCTHGPRFAPDDVGVDCRAPRRAGGAPNRHRPADTATHVTAAALREALA